MNEKAISVFEQYDLEIEQTFKLRGNYGCVTSNGKYILQEYDNSEEKLVTLSTLQEYLEQNKILTEKLILNKEGQFISISEDGYGYILKRFYDLEECNIRNVDHILIATEKLAEFHKCCIHMDSVLQETKGFHLGKNLIESYKKHNKEIINIRNYITKRKNKNFFERYLQNIIGEYYNQASRAYQYLEKSIYTEMYENASKTKQLCFGNFNHHSIGFFRSEPVLLNMCKICYAPKIHDIYDFLRKVLEKNEWDVDLGHRLLDCYDKTFHLEESDYSMIKALLGYPEKFWKIINYYYNSNKAWYSEKNEEKLKAFQNQENLRWNFIKTL